MRPKDVARIAEDGLAILAIVFNDRQTISSLAQLTRTLGAWNRMLPIYHQLLKSQSPADIVIVEVQNGSIDFIVNLDISVSLNLAELFKVGYKVFFGYLSYKKVIGPITETYFGNRKLIKSEDDREIEMLGNIGTAVQKKIRAQHTEAKKRDKTIKVTALNKMVELVGKLIVEHIVKGNDIKLLALPEREGETEEGEDHIEALREQSAAARHQLRQMPEEEKQKLLDAYGTIDDDTEE